MFFYACLVLGQDKSWFYLWHLKTKGPDCLDCSYTARPSNDALSLFEGFFPLKFGLEPGRNGTCVTHMQHRAVCFKTLNFPVEIFPVLLFSCSVHNTAKTCLFTHCESPLQTDRSSFESNIQHFCFRMGFSKL